MRAGSFAATGGLLSAVALAGQIVGAATSYEDYIGSGPGKVPGGARTAGEPILPGYLTDPTADWQELAVGAMKIPEKFRYPYVAVNDLEATVEEGHGCRIGWYVTDFDHSRVRFGDASRRFDITVKVTTDRESFRTFRTKNAPSGDGETNLGPLPVGEYFIGLTAVDRKTKLPSHTVWREFRVVPKEFFVIPPESVLTVTDALLAKYGIRVAETNDSAAEANIRGIQRLLDEAKTNGFQKVVMKKSVYRVSHKETLSIPDRMTFDLNGATLKLNGFAGSNAMMVKLAAVSDAHLVNGTLEGDYFEHDYEAPESKSANSEWVNGFDIRANSRYCSVENVRIVNITGYGGNVNQGKEGPHPANYPYAWQFAKERRVVPKELIEISEYAKLGFLQVGHFGGYQGNKLSLWQYGIRFYDAATNLLSGEIAHQFRNVLVPPRAKYAKLAFGVADDKAVRESGMVLQLGKWPVNCRIRNCVFDRCRAVGLVPCHSVNLVIEGNEFTRCGERLAKCAIDVEDGWDCAQDMLIANNRFHDNPNNEILTCSGHNIRILGNRGSIYTYPRTHSAAIAGNACKSVSLGVANRIQTGYARLGENAFHSLSFGIGAKEYAGWDIALDGRTFKGDGSDGRTSVIGGPCGRFRNCTFEGVDMRIMSAENCVFRKCHCRMAAVNVRGRWTDCRMESSAFGGYLGAILFVRSSFRDSVINANQMTCEFVGCDLTGNRFPKDIKEKSKFTNCRGL